MRLTEASLGNRSTVFFLLVGMIILGLAAWQTMPREAAPDITIPLIIVSTPYPGASPLDVESQVTRLVERELQGLEGLKKLTSTSQESVSVVYAEFVSGTNIDNALQKVRDRVDRAKVDFPDDAEEPLLQEINFSDWPIIQVNLSGDVGPAVLKDLAENLKDDLEALRGVLRVNLVGGLEREVRVDVDPELLRLHGLSLNDVVTAVDRENVSVPGGDMDLGDQTFAVRVPGEVSDPARIADFVIKSRRGLPVFVRDVARVRFAFKDRESFARIDGQESVALSVQKRQGANIIEVVRLVTNAVAAAERRFPAGVQVTILGDQSKDITKMVKDLENNILSGLTLVILVLLFALGLRNAVMVGLAIPFSMLLTFIAVQLSGTTLNMIVLFSLVLAVGMLVDNAIVVIENIYRHVQMGKRPSIAASEATREVGGAIVMSTLTTVGAFSPLFFWPGVVGDFMFFLPLTVSMALLASLTIAFTVNPVMSAAFMRPGERSRPFSDLDDPEEVEAGGEKIFGPRILAAYRWALAKALSYRAAVLAGMGLLFVTVLVVFANFNHGIEFFPETEPRQIFVDIDMAPGTRLEATDEVVRFFEDRLRDLPDLDVMAAGVGAGSQSEFGSSGGGGHKGRISLDLFELQERRFNSFATMEEVRRRTGDLAGVTVDVQRPQEGPPVGDPLAIEISGDDFPTLGRIAGRIRAAITDIPGLVSLDDDFDMARPEIHVVVDRTQAARLGLSTAGIAGTIRTAINGTKASTFRYGKKDADVTVRLAGGARTSLDALARLTVVNDDGVQIPLSAVARLERTSALTSINRKNQRRVVTVSGRVTSTDQAEPVRREAARRLEAIPDLLPAGYILSFSGQSEDEEEAKTFLTGAFLVALLIVLGLMVAKFDSLAMPLIIMTSVFMSMIGVLIGLLVTGLPFGIIMTGLGVISLAGIVVNNAIVLLDYGEQLVARGIPRRRAVMLTGERRLRPVTLTAITTILGLIPLTTGLEFDFFTFTFAAGGESSQWWQTMGVAVIFGLAFATFLTLIVVPVLYDLLLEVRERWAARQGRIQRA